MISNQGSLIALNLPDKFFLSVASIKLCLIVQPYSRSRSRKIHKKAGLRSALNSSYSNEEFPVVRAKRRPVILIRPTSETDHETSVDLPSASRPLPLIAPLYGVADAMGRQKYSTEFLAECNYWSIRVTFSFQRAVP